MHNITLIKSHPTVQLGHLYEHLFLRRVNEFFYEKGLYKLVDYSVHGTTFEEGGVIVVECDFYTPEAQKLAHELAELHIECGDDNQNVSIALQQMVAEEPYKIAISDKAMLLKELESIDKSPWQSIDSLGILDTTSIRRKSSPIHLSSEHQPQPRKVRASLVLDEEFESHNRELSPLFDTVARILLLTIGNRLSYRSGLYAGGEIETHGSPVRTSTEYWASQDVAATLDLDELRQSSLETIRCVCSSSTFNRLSRELSSVSFAEEPMKAPNVQRILNETGVLIGARGWQKIATPENISSLLEHMSLELTFGRSKQTETLS